LKWGKFLEAKFKPWGAVKAASTVGKAGRGLLVFAGASAVVMSIAAEYSEAKKEKDDIESSREMRAAIRKVYRESVDAMDREFWAQFEEASGAFYKEDIADIDNQIDMLVHLHETRTAEADEFLTRISRIKLEGTDLELLKYARGCRKKQSSV